MSHPCKDCHPKRTWCKACLRPMRPAAHHVLCEVCEEYMKDCFYDNRAYYDHLESLIKQYAALRSPS